MNKSDEQKLKQAFEDTIWMAIRYANGRHTYAPSMVRDAIKKFQEVYPNWQPRQDHTLKSDKEHFRDPNRSIDLDSDWLDDLVENIPEDNAVSDKTRGFSGNIAFIGDHDIDTDTYRVDILASAKDVFKPCAKS